MKPSYDALLKKAVLVRALSAKMSDFERQNRAENFRIVFTHDSTAIEGNTLPLAAVKMILEDGTVPAGTRQQELDEVRGHAAAWDFVREEAAKGTQLSESLIRDIHERVLPVKGIGGFYRSVAVSIRGAQHVPPCPHLVWNAMKNFAYQIEHREFPDDIEKAAWLHAELVKIHPFQDGNGRTARLVMNCHLMSRGLPPTSIKKKNREEYFRALEEYALRENILPLKNLLIAGMSREMDEFLAVHTCLMEPDGPAGHPVR